VSEVWIFILIIRAIFLHNMLHLVVGHLFQPTILPISTHMNRVHIISILIIMLVIV